MLTIEELAETLNAINGRISDTKKRLRKSEEMVDVIRVERDEFRLQLQISARDKLKVMYNIKRQELRRNSIS